MHLIGLRLFPLLRSSGAILVLCVSASGGGDRVVATRVNQQQAKQLAEIPFALQQLPDLHHCLGGLSRQLKKDAALVDLSLACLTVTYKGDLLPIGLRQQNETSHSNP